MADTEILRELNCDIWHPFRRTYAALDAPAFLALHGPELIRAGGPAKTIHGYADYAAQTEQWFADLAARGSSAEIDFRFTERIASGDLASERGTFRITARNAEGDTRLFHSRFHTYARKVDGRWRIVADYDTNDGGTVTADIHDGNVAIDDVDSFADPPPPAG